MTAGALVIASRRGLTYDGGRSCDSISARSTPDLGEVDFLTAGTF
jgi:hypothetical protein